MCYSDDCDDPCFDLEKDCDVGSEFPDMDEQGFRGHPVEMAEEEDYEEGYDGDIDEPGIRFADPGGDSALRAASPTNPRIYPCPTCHRPNQLTLADQAHSYQCDGCAEQDERGF